MAKRSKDPRRKDTDGAAAVVIRTRDDQVGSVSRSKAATTLVRLAARWMYTLRSRSRWVADPDDVTQVQAAALKTLLDLGIAKEALQKASRTTQIEVEVVDTRASGEDQPPGEHAAAAFPWEFVLSAATSTLGRSEPLLITRLLNRKAAAPAALPTSLMFVQCAPGRFSDVYSFDQELARLKAATGSNLRPSSSVATGATATRPTWRVSDDDTLERMQSRIGRSSPGAIHVSAIDNHQAARVVPDFYESPDVLKIVGKEGPEDGIVVRGSTMPEEPVPFYTLAEFVVSGGKPLLVTCNAYYSSRTAEEFVRRGAYAALGFQDEVNDELAELFFQEFYRSWYAGHAADLPRAFGNAFHQLREEGHQLFGTGIVLWLGRSAFERLPAIRSSEEEEGDESPTSRLPTDSERVEAHRLPISEVLQVELKAPKEVNYSLLHNSRPFLEKLTLSKLVEHPLDEVSVLVDLNVGDGSYPFRRTELLLEGSQRSLGELVQVPLTAPLLRSLRERVQSTLYAKVTWNNRVAYEQTHSVTLLPVDEWLDDTDQNPWLPSFVLPRDPAVARVVAAARRHLITLLDDSGAGFDGYQSIDNELEDPAENVDLQVQAIWAALVHEFKIMYINPPPAYARRTQRLRTPSEVLASNSGTCLDLALLLAACLEYVDIYPIVVLLSGHAFVGYWRNSDDHDRFRAVSDVPSSIGLNVGPLSRGNTVALVDQYGWRLARQQYMEIRQYLRRDRLRCLEATGLCFNFSFAEALEEGAANLRSSADFDSVLDIRLARCASPAVTPLPILSVISAPADEPGTR